VTSTQPAVPPAFGPADDVARVRGPGDLAAVVPSLLGFAPAQSLVVVLLAPPRQRVALTMRADVPKAEHVQAWPAVVATMRPAAARSGAQSAAVLVYSADPGDLDRAVEHVTPMLADLELQVVDVLRVHEGRWYSGMCRDASCCPPDGVPVPAQAPAVAQLVVQGAVVRASRSDLRAEFAPPTGEQAVAVARAVDQAATRLVRTAAGPTLGVTPSSMPDELDRAVAAMTFGPLTPDLALRLAVLVQDGDLRDAVYRHLVGGTDHQARIGAHRALWAAVCRGLPDLDPVVPLMLFSLAAYLDGTGASANLAFEQAHAWDPDHPTVRLFGDVMAAGIPPSSVLQTLAQAVAL
jgi:hypothetical protein